MSIKEANLRCCCLVLEQALVEGRGDRVGEAVKSTADAVPPSSDGELDEVFMDMFPLLCRAAKQWSPTGNQTRHLLGLIARRSNPREVLLLACEELADLHLLNRGDCELSITLMGCLCTCIERHTRALAHSMKAALQAVIALNLTASEILSLSSLDTVVADSIARTLQEGAKSTGSICTILCQRGMGSQCTRSKALVCIALMVSLATTVLPLPWSDERSFACESLLLLLSRVLFREGHNGCWPRDAAKLEMYVEQFVADDMHEEVHRDLVPQESGSALKGGLLALKYVNVVQAVHAHTLGEDGEDILYLSHDLVGYAEYAGPECLRKASRLLVEAAKGTRTPSADRKISSFHVDSAALLGTSDYKHILLFVQAWTAVVKCLAFQPEQDLRENCADYLRESICNLEVKDRFLVLRCILCKAHKFHPLSVTFVMSILHEQVVKNFPLEPFHFDAVLGLIATWIQPTEDVWTDSDDLVTFNVPVCAAANTLYFMVRKARGRSLSSYDAQKAKYSILPLKEVLDSSSRETMQNLGPLHLAVSDILNAAADAS
eukprot:scaffold1483_cov374-Pavlova_lutheri.AAC.5